MGRNSLVAAFSRRKAWGRSVRFRTGIFGVAVKGPVGGVIGARLESADLRASFPATLCHAPSGVGRRRGYLGLTPPQPPLWLTRE